MTSQLGFSRAGAWPSVLSVTVPPLVTQRPLAPSSLFWAGVFCGLGEGIPDFSCASLLQKKEVVETKAASGCDGFISHETVEGLGRFVGAVRK